MNKTEYAPVNVIQLGRESDQPGEMQLAKTAVHGPLA